MLNGGSVSWCSKRQLTVAFSSTEAEYIALILAAKKVMWLRLLLTELGFLQPNQHYALIKVSKGNKCIQHIQQDWDIVRGRGSKSELDRPIVILLKRDN